MTHRAILTIFERVPNFRRFALGTVACNAILSVLKRVRNIGRQTFRGQMAHPAHHIRRTFRVTRGQWLEQFTRVARQARRAIRNRVRRERRVNRFFVTHGTRRDDSLVVTFGKQDRGLRAVTVGTILAFREWMRQRGRRARANLVAGQTRRVASLAVIRG